MTQLIKLDNVYKIYKLDEVEVPAINGISLEINKGDFAVVIGPSGSGKSTAMNLIGCLDIPTQGSIYLDTHNISKLRESDLAQIRGKKIGFVFQTFNLISSLTALENVALPMTFQNIPRKEKLRKAYSLLELVGLKDRTNHLPAQLSGGQRQRVAIARALANNPEVILADEPTGNLDTKTGEEIMNLFLQLHKEGTTIIVVTHDSNIANHTQKILKMRDGIFVEEKNGKKKTRKWESMVWFKRI